MGLILGPVTTQTEGGWRAYLRWRAYCQAGTLSIDFTST